MKNKSMLKLTKYYTMNSWNRETAPAYNIKLYNIGLNNEEQGKLLDFMQYENAYDLLNEAIYEFNVENNAAGFKAGINGRSGGYLVLYKKDSNRGFEAADVPQTVLDNFEQLALRIIDEARWLAHEGRVVTVERVIQTKELAY